MQLILYCICVIFHLLQIKSYSYPVVFKSSWQFISTSWFSRMQLNLNCILEISDKADPLFTFIYLFIYLSIVMYLHWKPSFYCFISLYQWKKFFQPKRGNNFGYVFSTVSGCLFAFDKNLKTTCNLGILSTWDEQCGSLV